MLTDIGKANLNDLPMLKDIKVDKIYDKEKEKSASNIMECFNPKARTLFNEWYDKYCDPRIGKLTKETATLIIFDTTNEIVGVDDSRITGRIQKFAHEDNKECESFSREEYFNYLQYAATTDLDLVHIDLINA